MRMTSLPCILSLALLFAAPLAATADSYRCGRKLIHTGDSTADVLRVCGQPLSKDRGHADVRVEGVTRNLPVERWHYKRSARSLGRIVLLHRGRVVSIEMGRR